MAASETNPAVHEADFQSPNLNDRFTPKRTLASTKYPENEGLIAAKFEGFVTAQELESALLALPDAGDAEGG